jgi:alanyl-tRNA synthetase
LTGKPYGKDRSTDASLRILADHSRAAAFLIGDGVIPFERRARLRSAQDHSPRRPARPNARPGAPVLVRDGAAVAEEMREPYPELLESINRVAGVIKHEEERFAHTMDLGLKKLEEDLASYLDPKNAQR